MSGFSLANVLGNAMTFGIGNGDYQMSESAIALPEALSDAIPLQLQQAGRLPEKLSQDVVGTAIETEALLREQAKQAQAVANANINSMKHLEVIAEQEAKMKNASVLSQVKVAGFNQGLQQTVAGARGLRMAMMGASFPGR